MPEQLLITEWMQRNSNRSDPKAFINSDSAYFASELADAIAIAIHAASQPQGGHADTEGDMLALDAHLNCPACGGSGHVDDTKPSPDFETAWRQLSDQLEWIQTNPELKAYWGWNLAAVANDLIRRAYPHLKLPDQTKVWNGRSSTLRNEQHLGRVGFALQNARKSIETALEIMRESWGAEQMEAGDDQAAVVLQLALDRLKERTDG